MAKSRIEWTEEVWNPLTGCTRIGQGCKNCYAERMSKRLIAMGRTEYAGTVDAKGHWTGNINLLHDKVRDPLRWKKPRRIFVNSMSDLFHQDVPQAFINDVMTVMQNAPQHTYLILTKRYDRPPLALYPQDASPQVWIGYSICNNEDARKAREFLRMVDRDGWNTWISYEPALEQVDWRGFEFVKWLVCGGESGPHARPMHPYWARKARDWCQRSMVPFFFKQWGEWKPVAELYDDDGPDKAFEEIDHWLAQMEPNGTIPVMTPPIHTGDGGWHEYQPCPGSWFMAKVGKKDAGRELDGQTWDEYPDWDEPRRRVTNIPSASVSV